MTDKNAQSDFHSKHATDMAELQRLEARKTQITQTLCDALGVSACELSMREPSDLDAQIREDFIELRTLDSRTGALRSKINIRKLNDFLANPDGAEERRWWLGRY